jgi:hypothetical protein
MIFNLEVISKASFHRKGAKTLKNKVLIIHFLRLGVLAVIFFRLAFESTS